MHTVHGNAVCVTRGVTFGAGWDLKQKKYFCSHKGAMWMEMICMFWTAVSKPLSIRPVPAPSIVVEKTPLTALL